MQRCFQLLHFSQIVPRVCTLVLFIPIELAAAFILLITYAPSKPAASPTMIDPGRIRCTKEGGIAEAAREALKDLDKSLLDVDTNCEDADEDDYMYYYDYYDDKHVLLIIIIIIINSLTV